MSLRERDRLARAPRWRSSFYSRSREFGSHSEWMATSLQGSVDPAGPSNPLLKNVTREAGGWLSNYRQAPVSAAAPIVAYLGAMIAALALRLGALRSAFLASSAGGRGRDRHGRVQSLSFPAAVVEPSRSQPDRLGLVVQSDDADHHARGGRDLFADRPRLYELGLLRSARAGDGSRHRAKRRLPLLNRRRP